GPVRLRGPARGPGSGLAVLPIRCRCRGSSQLRLEQRAGPSLPTELLRLRRPGRLLVDPYGPELPRRAAERRRSAVDGAGVLGQGVLLLVEWGFSIDLLGD